MGMRGREKEQRTGCFHSAGEEGFASNCGRWQARGIGKGKAEEEGGKKGGRS